MNDNILKLATLGVQQLQPYQPGKPLSELEREYGIRSAVKLASNENPLGPGSMALAAIKNALADLSRYPDGNGHNLKHALSATLSVQPDMITLGNGSNDVLEIIARAFATEHDEIMFSEYAFAVYPIVTQAIGATANIVPAKNWGHDLEAMATAVTDKTKIIFLANPNNPTGTWFNKDELEKFLNAVPENVIIVLDEAYFEFAAHQKYGNEYYPDGTIYLPDYKNLIITRTFSKAYGLAGLRMGYAVSHPDITNILNRVRQPFNVNSLALCAAEAALSDTEYLENYIQLNAEQYQGYARTFEKTGIEFIPSAGIFISVRVGDAGKVYESLLQKGVITRPVANYGMTEYLRISIGTADENNKCLTALLAELGHD